MKDHLTGEVTAGGDHNGTVLQQRPCCCRRDRRLQAGSSCLQDRIRDSSLGQDQVRRHGVDNDVGLRKKQSVAADIDLCGKSTGHVPKWTTEIHRPVFIHTLIVSTRTTDRYMNSSESTHPLLLDVSLTENNPQTLKGGLLNASCPTTNQGTGRMSSQQVGLMWEKTSPRLEQCPKPQVFNKFWTERFVHAGATGELSLTLT